MCNDIKFDPDLRQFRSDQWHRRYRTFSRLIFAFSNCAQLILQLLVYWQCDCTLNEFWVILKRSNFRDFWDFAEQWIDRRLDRPRVLAVFGHFGRDRAPDLALIQPHRGLGSWYLSDRPGHRDRIGRFHRRQFRLPSQIGHFQSVNPHNQHW